MICSLSKSSGASPAVAADPSWLHQPSLASSRFPLGAGVSGISGVQGGSRTAVMGSYGLLLYLLCFGIGRALHQTCRGRVRIQLLRTRVYEPVQGHRRQEGCAATEDGFVVNGTCRVVVVGRLRISAGWASAEKGHCAWYCCEHA